MVQSLEEILLGREAIAREMQELLYEATDPWGVTVERVEVKDVRVPESLQRAMAAEAEAARDARAKVTVMLIISSWISGETVDRTRQTALPCRQKC